MTARHTITPASLDALFAALGSRGIRVIAPRLLQDRLPEPSARGREPAGQNGVELGVVRAPAEVAQGHIQSIASAKAVVFPKVEKILGYRTSGKDLSLEEPIKDACPTVVFGIRPCEARAFAALDALFNWDCRDEFFNRRLAETTIVSIACTESDEACFCTSLGSGPDDPSGSDVLLRPSSRAGYAAEVLTEKGEALVALIADRLAAAGEGPEDVPLAAVEKAFDGVALGVALARSFDAPIWAEQSLRCLGCGACAFVCPTCACFDIQDEPEPAGDSGGADRAARPGGRRLRCWDSCGLSTFTLHASGHNPRDRQAQRWRQRVYHKFVYYPERLGRLGCVGCGKCSRACPSDMNLKEHLAEVVKAS